MIQEFGISLVLQNTEFVDFKTYVFECETPYETSISALKQQALDYCISRYGKNPDFTSNNALYYGNEKIYLPVLNNEVVSIYDFLNNQDISIFGCTFDEETGSITFVNENASKHWDNARFKFKNGEHVIYNNTDIIPELLLLTLSNYRIVDMMNIHTLILRCLSRFVEKRVIPTDNFHIIEKMLKSERGQKVLTDVLMQDSDLRFLMKKYFGLKFQIIKV